MASIPIEAPSAPGRTWPAAVGSALRVAFGIIWAIDASLKWDASFQSNFVGYLHNAAQGQPAWLAPWFTFWINLVTPNVEIFAWLVRITETIIAACLLLGLARKSIYLIGILFSVLIWSTAEGFGGPYTSSATDIGAAIIYVLLFVALIVINRDEGRSPYSLDYYIEQRWPGWRHVSEWGGSGAGYRERSRLPWYQQGLAILGIIVVLILLIGSLHSTTDVMPPTPDNAAAAVTPLDLASPNPIDKARDATLPPLLGTGKDVNLNLVASDAKVQIASGVYYEAWTFGKEAPGPTFHLRQGQTVHVTFTNHGTMDHSIDFHAAQVPWDQDFKSIPPGKSISFSFVASTPGAFIYHCGTPPVLMHMANGMYGAVIVDPATPLPPADVSYVLVQSEWYTSQDHGNTMTYNFDKMMAETPDEVVFNGAAFQYRDHPLPAKAGKTVRLYVVDAGPNLPSAFHVIGGMFAKVYPDGDPAHAQTGVSVYTVAPGQGVVFDVVFPNPGKYPIVDHSMRNMQIGAEGLIDVTR